MTINKITENIYLGNANDAQSLPHLQEHGITALLNCAFDLDYVQKQVLTTKVGLIDGPGNKASSLTTAVDILNILVKQDNKVLVHCFEGKSRSPTVVATYLAHQQKKSLKECLVEIKQIRSVVDPKEALIILAEKVLLEMVPKFPEDIRKRLFKIRREIEMVFAEDTASIDGWNENIPSSGHCAAVSIIVKWLLGGEYMSAIVGGQSHWFNRIIISNGYFDVDLTGDQFGQDEVLIFPAGQLYPLTKIRYEQELRTETIRRAILLAERADLDGIKNITSLLADR